MRVYLHVRFSEMRIQNVNQVPKVGERESVA